MLITARANTGDVDNRGVIGHAVSPDLESWEVREPLSEPGAGFGHVEVPQATVMNDRTVLLFSCGVDALAARRREGFGGGGIWSLEADQTNGPFNVASAAIVTTAQLYSGRLIQNRAGQWMMLACHDASSDGFFEGVVSDPIPVRWDAESGLTMMAPPTSTAKAH